ncbi:MULTISPECIES: type III secretion system export apparatus subunit SctR [Roseateles]|uniref:type III secretion system export apparatus subunit SctR n=1 Tax=Roseateles TaxID=93681 RepID=UPI0022EBAA93|nr:MULTISPECIES: type III secretion system export apparatus subunit SctR [Roseateles]WIW00313.1 type III secretion system export apparatus subunit SctR [Paucibacter aquatile]
MNQFSPASALLTVVLLSLAPFVAVMVTSFTKLVVVFGLLRNALALQQTPPNIVLNGLALVLSVYVMYPVGVQMQQRIGDKPLGSNAQAMLAAADQAKEPLREFLIRHTRPLERAFFLKTAQRSLPPDAAEALSERDFIVVVPAFTVSELSVAFEIGFLIFLPFLVVDLVVANILMAMGMQMLSPTTVSLPFKLLLFVLIDGWVKLVHGLILTYH